MLKLNPQCGSIGRLENVRRWSLWEEQGSFKKKPEELGNVFQPVRIQTKGAIFEEGSKPSLGFKSATALILNFRASRTVSNEFLSFLNYLI
jgi:hypothetical protein